MLVKVSKTIQVSLDAVCNINVLNDKQVFNMCYTYTDKNGVMSGYYYVDLFNTSYKKSKYFQKYFIEIKGIDRTILVNKKFISFIKKDYSNFYPKIILGFKHSVLRHNVSEITFAPEYMYIKVNPDEIDEKFDALVKSINNSEEMI